MKKILLHGYGNPGRRDDGLGHECIAMIERWRRENDIPHIDTDDSYQLNIEDASVIAEYDVVIFIDASKGDIESFSFGSVSPQPASSFTTHSISPPALLALCIELFNHTPLVYLLQIKGYEWEFGEGLSLKASKNLENAALFLQSTLLDLHNRESGS